MSKKAREKPAEAGSASVSPYGSVLSYELVTSQPNRLINLIWPECRTWFIGPWVLYLQFIVCKVSQRVQLSLQRVQLHPVHQPGYGPAFSIGENIKDFLLL